MTYRLKLETLGPVFVGSGQKLGKKEFRFAPNTREVTVYDETKFLHAIFREKAMSAYEDFMLNRPKEALHTFLSNRQALATQLNDAVLYTVDATNAFVSGNPLTEISQFMRDAHDRPYIPGSSLKGALRTVLLCEMVELEEHAAKRNEAATILRRTPLDDRYETSKAIANIEALFFHTLNRNTRDRNSPTNSIMQAVSISDSEPIDPSNIFLTKKSDLHPYGNVEDMPITRECLRPSTTVEFMLTLDTSMSGDITKDFIERALYNYASFYDYTYTTRFDFPHNMAMVVEAERLNANIYLGGGSGYFSKNVLYIILGEKRALPLVSQMMSSMFRNHRHGDDIGLNISPRKLKLARYNQKYYPMGACNLTIESVP